MELDVQSYIDKACALESEWESAWTARKSTRAAVRQARRALREAPAVSGLKEKLQLAMEDESKANKHFQQVEERLEMERTDRLALIASLGTGKLTLREFVECPTPGIGQRITPRAPCSETQPVAPRTYGEVLRWPGLRKGASKLLNSLDNTRRIYDEPRCGVTHGGSYEAAACQADVFGRVMNLTDMVNYVLKQLGNSVKCSGGGGGRSMSCTDLIVRLTSAQSSLTDMSRQVLATILVKGDWDFYLNPGESLEEALMDPQRGEAIAAAVQEAYGKAVVDEAPIFVLTNHNVTVFFKRSRDVRDTRLWASEPLWISDTDPSACAMWAHALQQAEELQSWKPLLPRADVPINVEEQHTQTHQQQVDVQRQRLAKVSLLSTEQSSASAGSAASDDSAASSRKRKHSEDMQPEEHNALVRPVRQCNTDVNVRPEARKPLSKAHETDGHTFPQPASTGLEMEETVPLSELGLTGESLGEFQYGFTLKGTCEGKPTAVKVYNLRKRGALAAYKTERDCYHKLKPLQGKAIPYLLRSGLQAHTAAPVIVTPYEGQALAEREPVPLRLHKLMREALQALHAMGVAHTYVSRSFFVMKGDEVQMVDFQWAALEATEEQKSTDMMALQHLLYDQYS